MPNSTSKRTVFVSYAKEDAAQALQLAAALENAGVHVWLDKKDLLAGHDWMAEIEIAIEQVCMH